jgi:hypothetical protein
LIEALVSCGYNIQIETDGSGDILARRIGFLTDKIYISTSPNAENNWNYIYADELKYKINESFYSDVIPRSFEGPIYIEPELNNRRSLERAIEIARYNPKWKLSIPFKRFINIK